MATAIRCRILPIQSGSFGAYGSQHFIRKYWSVTLDGPATDGNGWKLAAQANPGGGEDFVLQPGFLDSTTNFWVTKVGADPESGDESGINWVAWCEEASDPYAGSNALPWLRKDEAEQDCAVYSVPMVKDFSDTPLPVVNSAKDRPANPIMQDLINPKWRIKRFRRVSEFDRDEAQQCQGSVNESGFTIADIAGNISVAAECAVLRRVVANGRTWTDSYPGTNYYDIVLEIEVQGQYPPGSAAGDGSLKYIDIEDAGFYGYVTANDISTKVHLTNKMPDPTNTTGANSGYAVYPPGDPQSGSAIMIPVCAPVFLSSDGTRYTGSNVEVCVKRFQRYPVKDWSSFIV